MNIRYNVPRMVCQNNDKLLVIVYIVFFEKNEDYKCIIDKGLSRMVTQ